MTCDLDTPVPDWVIDYPESLAVFKEFGIDYCCGGKSLEAACRERNLDERIVLSTLRARIAASATGDDGPKRT